MYDHPMQAIDTPNRARSLTADLVQRLGDRIRHGELVPGAKLPREADLMTEYGVSRTVVREAMSQLQAGGMVETRHGIGTFVVGLGQGTHFRIPAHQLGTLHDVIAVLELRIAVETEAAGLAAKFQCHVIVGHSHIWKVGRDISGRYWAIAAGHCADEERMAYAAIRHSKRMSHVSGAVIIRDGFPWVLNEWTPWDRLKKCK